MKRIFLIVLFMGFQALASKEVGNGGDVVVCKNLTGLGPNETYELLDYYEAREMRGIQIDLNPYLASDAKNLALSVVKRLTHLNLIRELYYERAIEDFFQNQQMISGIELVDIPDSQHVILKTGCRIQQAIIQRTSFYPEDKRYIIDADLWNKLNLETQTGLILHEIIYREAILAEQTDSRHARYFHSYLAGNKFNEMTLPKYVEFLYKVEFPDFDYQGVNLLLCKPDPKLPELNRCGQRVFFNFEPTSGLPYLGGEVVPQFAPWSKANVIGEFEQSILTPWNERVYVVGEIRWHSNGQVSSFYPREQNIIPQGDYLFAGITVDALFSDECQKTWNCGTNIVLDTMGSGDGPIVLMSEEGALLRYSSRENQTLQLGQLDVNCKSRSPIEIEPSRNLSKCLLYGLQHFSDNYYDVWSQGEIRARDGVVTSLDGIESGELSWTAQNAKQFTVSVSSFSFLNNDPRFITFRTAKSWAGYLMNEMVSYEPGYFMMNADTAEPHYIQLDQPQQFHISKLSSQPLTLKSARFNYSGQLEQFDFVGNVQLNSQAMQPTVYVGPGTVLLRWPNGQPVVEMCVTATNEFDESKRCTTYSANIE